MDEAQAATTDIKDCMGRMEESFTLVCSTFCPHTPLCTSIAMVRWVCSIYPGSDDE